MQCPSARKVAAAATFNKGDPQLEPVTIFAAIAIENTRLCWKGRCGCAGRRLESSIVPAGNSLSRFLFLGRINIYR
jgi:hypothetical protein